MAGSLRLNAAGRVGWAQAPPMVPVGVVEARLHVAHGGEVLLELGPVGRAHLRLHLGEAVLHVVDHRVPPLPRAREAEGVAAQLREDGVVERPGAVLVGDWLIAARVRQHRAHLGAAVLGGLHAHVERLEAVAGADGVAQHLVDAHARAPARQRAVAAHLAAAVEVLAGQERHAALVRLAGAGVVGEQVEPAQHHHLVLEGRERLQLRAGEVHRRRQGEVAVGRVEEDDALGEGEALDRLRHLGRAHRRLRAAEAVQERQRQRASAHAPQHRPPGQLRHMPPADL